MGKEGVPSLLPAPTASEVRTKEARRVFLRTAAVGAGVVGLALAGGLPVVGERHRRLRPPGALDEHDFLASCIKCGQCIQVCPVSALKPADVFDGFGIGAPLIEPRAQSCDFSCDVGQCILACPTGALTYHKPDFLSEREGAVLPKAPVLLANLSQPDPTLQFRERMGVARLARPEVCLSVRNEGLEGPARPSPFRGKKRYAEIDRWKPALVRDHEYELSRCDVCVRECPIQGALSIEEQPGPDGSMRATPVVHEACVGCGVCEMLCPTEPAAIVVDARATWEGES